MLLLILGNTVLLQYLLSTSTTPNSQLGRDEIYDLLVEEVLPKLFVDEDKSEIIYYATEVSYWKIFLETLM